MSDRGWTIVGAPAPSIHSWVRGFALAGVVETWRCEDCALFYSSGKHEETAADVEARETLGYARADYAPLGSWFLRVKPTGFGLDDRARYVYTKDEPADCYAMRVEALEAAE